jgi:SAM-dependent methyltransferase
MNDWWTTFFDRDYLYLWSNFFTADQTERQVDGLWEILHLKEGSRVLDAPCGYGRISVPLARRGAVVLGVDQSAELLNHAEQGRGDLAGSLGYKRHDLRQGLNENSFDVAINLFSSLGYGSEQDDLAILQTLRDAVRPGGLVFLETNHRDATAAYLSRAGKPAQRLADGTLIVEEPSLDALTGRVNTCWYWSGPNGSGQKRASFRIYNANEMIRLMEQAGLEFISAHRGCSAEPFQASGMDMGGRLGLLSQRK